MDPGSSRSPDGESSHDRGARARNASGERHECDRSRLVRMIEGSLDHEPALVTSFDGTSIAARRMGSANGEPLLIAPTIGAGLSPWRQTLRRVVQDVPVVTWDLRGQYDSGPVVSTRV